MHAGDDSASEEEQAEAASFSSIMVAPAKRKKLPDQGWFNSSDAQRKTLAHEKFARGSSGSESKVLITHVIIVAGLNKHQPGPLGCQLPDLKVRDVSVFGARAMLLRGDGAEGDLHRCWRTRPAQPLAAAQ